MIETFRYALRYSDVIDAFVDPYWYVTMFRHELCEPKPGMVPELRAVKLNELRRRFGIQGSGVMYSYDAKWQAEKIRLYHTIFFTL